MRYSICFLLAILLIISAAPNVNAELYYWVDENGVKHFSNEPPPRDVEKFNKAPETRYNPHLDKSRMARDRQWQEDEIRRIRENADKIIKKNKAESAKIDKSVKDDEIARKKAEDTARIERLQRRVRNNKNYKKKKLKYKLDKLKKKYQELYQSQPDAPAPKQ